MGEKNDADRDLDHFNTPTTGTHNLEPQITELCNRKNRGNLLGS